MKCFSCGEHELEESGDGDAIHYWQCADDDCCASYDHNLVARIATLESQLAAQRAIVAAYDELGASAGRTPEHIMAVNQRLRQARETAKKLDKELDNAT